MFPYEKKYGQVEKQALMNKLKLVQAMIPLY